MSYYNDGYGEEFGEEFGAEAPQLDGVLVGIPATSVAAAATVVINVNVTKPFRADRLILDAASRAAGMFVDQISISSEEQIISPNGVPAEVFTPDATHKLRGTIVQPGVGINLTVRNTTAGAVVFTGAFFGPAQR